MSIRLFNPSTKVQPVCLMLGYSPETNGFVDTLVYKLLSACEDPVDVYIDNFTGKEPTEHDFIWSIHTIQKTDILVTMIDGSTEEEFKKSLNIINAYAKHPDARRGWFIVECSSIMDNEEYINVFNQLIMDPENRFNILPINGMEYVVENIASTVKGVADLSFYGFKGQEEVAEAVEESAEGTNEECCCEECDCCDHYHQDDEDVIEEEVEDIAETELTMNESEDVEE